MFFFILIESFYFPSNCNLKRAKRKSDQAQKVRATNEEGRLHGQLAQDLELRNTAQLERAKERQTNTPTLVARVFTFLSLLNRK